MPVHWNSHNKVRTFNYNKPATEVGRSNNTRKNTKANNTKNPLRAISANNNRVSLRNPFLNPNKAIAESQQGIHYTPSPTSIENALTSAAATAYNVRMNEIQNWNMRSKSRKNVRSNINRKPSLLMNGTQYANPMRLVPLSSSGNNRW